ncbi:MAG: hypothetical protein A2675_03260 [Candidatus Yonathbacteria bacterium RIFCSPHIGHO2_01_FULL_51_10]|uniref:Uncharacterized protein n=1 Tax=Candidatus Yonathbacteria bacterium RIFCSPHIGHO2_01_FULL_51_10 TaxID=1802723 RepID=A0A1G2S8Q1_9BACT|nr:MAG: hypothetical protein A2675_03260 [Candidatus Yonathbacteria bacterium RIFCSPHIGHO2_01_FULL_51_10]
MANETLRPLLLDGWKSREVRVTEKMITAYKDEEQQHLHCRYCLRVLEVGTTVIKITIPARRNRLSGDVFFCQVSCERKEYLKLTRQSLSMEPFDTYDVLEATTLHEAGFF